MQRAAKAVLVVTVGIACAVLLVACAGESKPLLRTEDVVTALAASGFENVVVHSNRAACRDLARRIARVDCKDSLDLDWIAPPGQTPLTAPISAVRMPSIELAVKRYDADFAMRESDVPRDVLPPGYSLSRYSEVRICNVVLTSYGASASDELHARFADVARRLRERCE